eukprot:2420614-Rhodomonas_salina.4
MQFFVLWRRFSACLTLADYNLCTFRKRMACSFRQLSRPVVSACWSTEYPGEWLRGALFPQKQIMSDYEIAP